MKTVDLRRELRRNQDTLAIFGQGVVAFGIWSIIRTLTTYYYQFPEFWKSARTQEYPVLHAVLTFLIVAILIALMLALRAYIGLSARAEAMRGQRKTAYLFAAGVLIIGQLFLVAAEVWVFFYDEMDTDRIVSCFIELTSAVTIIEMIVASCRVKRITKALENRQE